MNDDEREPAFHMTRAARDAIAAAIARHSHPVVVRVAILPSVPPMARMYLETPQREDEVVTFGQAGLVVDKNSRWWIQGATIDFSPGSPRGSFSIKGPRLGFDYPAHPVKGQVAEPIDLKGVRRDANLPD